MKKQSLMLKLHDIGAVKFGSYKLKSGILSPIYIDLRLIVSYPDILRESADVLWDVIKPLKFDLVCGVPYTALPFATVISLEHKKPMVMRRKEIKEHGTKKIIEGSYQPGQNCLIIEDLITSGMSIFETIEPLENEKLKVTDVAVLIDREQGGKIKLAKHGYNLHSAFTLTELLHTLEASHKLEKEMSHKVKEFIQSNQVVNI